MAVRISRHKLLQEARTPYLTAQDREEVAALLARLEAECAQDVRRVILYGSKARGGAESESDIDLLIVARPRASADVSPCPMIAFAVVGCCCCP